MSRRGSGFGLALLVAGLIAGIGAAPLPAQVADAVLELEVADETGQVLPGATPFTFVFSDPAFAGGRGERMFVNAIGAAGHFGPELLEGLFFEADIAILGGTAIVPPCWSRIFRTTRSPSRIKPLCVIPPLPPAWLS